MHINDLFTDDLLLEARANYDAMLAAFKTNPDIGDREKKWIDDSVSWAKRVLKKSDRVIWYLRYIKGLCLDLVSKDDGDQLDGEKYISTFDHDSLSPHSAYGYHWVSTQRFKDDMEHFLSLNCPAIDNMQFGKKPIRQVMDELNAAETEWKKEASGKIPDGHKSMDKAEKLIDFGDGWVWFDLHKASCDVEGMAMGHCGNSPRSYTDDDVLSLRQRRQKGNQVFWEPHLTFTLDSKRNIIESKGKGNEKPAPKYHAMIVALFLSGHVKQNLGGGYLPQNNFNVSQLDPELRKKLVSKKPEMGNAYEYFTYSEDMNEAVFRNKLREDLYSNGDKVVFRVDDTDNGKNEKAKIYISLFLPLEMKRMLVDHPECFIPDVDELLDRDNLFKSKEEEQEGQQAVNVYRAEINKKLDIIRAKAKEHTLKILKPIEQTVADCGGKLSYYFDYDDGEDGNGDGKGVNDISAAIPLNGFFTNFYGTAEQKAAIEPILELSDTNFRVGKETFNSKYTKLMQPYLDTAYGLISHYVAKIKKS